MLALTGRMLDRKNDDLLGFLINLVIDQIRITPRHELTHASNLLLPPDMRKHAARDSEIRYTVTVFQILLRRDLA